MYGRSGSAAVLAAAAVLGGASTARATGLGAQAAPSGEPAIVIGEHATTFETDAPHAGRAHNVAFAASRLDGAILAPGETFSFNERVGPRTREAGFRAAPEIQDGALRDGVGGGTCQVATTLHVAALQAGLEIVEIRQHSLLSHYAEPGMDATVSYGRIDFRLRNPHAFPVRVRAVAEDGVLRVRLEGAEPVAATPVSVQIARRIRPSERQIEDASLAPGRRQVVERGRDGMIVVVRTTGRDGRVRERWVRYDVQDRVVRVGAAR